MAIEDTFDNRHPSDSQLDQLRAGLFDEEPALRTRVEQHVASCGRCQQRAGVWERANNALMAVEQPHSAALGAELRRRRVTALAQDRGQRRLLTGPVLALAATVAAVAIGLGVFLNGPEESAPAVATNAVIAEPDLYAEIDFFIWLSQQDERMKQSNGNST